jgi:hypothetical protein
MKVAFHVDASTSRHVGDWHIATDAQLLLFLDDMIPSLFGKPLLSDKPERSLIAWH